MTIEQRHDPLKPDAEQRKDLLRRALAAWFQTGGTEAPNDLSGVKVRKGLVYVVLHGASGVLAVYRARQVQAAGNASPRAMLQRMKRWPESVGN